VSKEPLTVNQRWIKQAKGMYDFDVTKADNVTSLMFILLLTLPRSINQVYLAHNHV
jgi:hypothetical protein